MISHTGSVNGSSPCGLLVLHLEHSRVAAPTDGLRAGDDVAPVGGMCGRPRNGLTDDSDRSAPLRVSLQTSWLEPWLGRRSIPDEEVIGEGSLRPQIGLIGERRLKDAPYL